METWVLAGWVLASNGDMRVRCSEMETWVLVGCMLASNGDMGACWVGADQPWRWNVCVVWVLINYVKGMCVM